jgi:hypothetical protein
MKTLPQFHLSISSFFFRNCLHHPKSRKTTNAPPNIIFIIQMISAMEMWVLTDKIKIKRLASTEWRMSTAYQSLPGHQFPGPSRSCLLTGTNTGHTGAVRGNPNWTTSGADVAALRKTSRLPKNDVGYNTAIMCGGMDEAGTSAQANALRVLFYFTVIAATVRLTIITRKNLS